MGPDGQTGFDRRAAWHEESISPTLNTMLAHIGHSDDPVSLDAIEDVIQQLEDDLQGAAPKAALLFCSVEYEHQVILDAIQARWPGLPLVGGTSDGEISTRLGFCDDSVLLTIFSGDDLVVYAGLGRNLSENVDAAVKASLGDAAPMSPKLCLTTFAPSTDASAVLKALSKSLDSATCPVLGGLSADHREFQRTAEFFGSEVLTDSLPLLLVEGSLDVSWGVGSGWFPVGDSMTVTSAEGNVVHEIDGKPAVQVYRERYGEVPSAFLGEYPLAFMDPSGTWVLRASLNMDGDERSLTFAGAIPTGSEVRFTQVVEEGLLSGSEEALERALDSFAGDSPQMGLVFTCAARKWVLGSEVAKEIELLRALAMDRGLVNFALAGLYCFGEIAPSHGGSENRFHNETCVSVVVG